MPRTLIACLFVGLLPTAASADWLGLEFPLTSGQQVRNLAFTPSKIGGPVKLTGVVTHVNPHTNELWVQDGAAGVFIKPHRGAAKLAVGDLVEVAGVTEEGSFAPCVVARQVKKLGKGTLPNPVPSNLTIEESRWQDGLWVEAYVVVRGTRTANGMTHVEALTARGRGTIVLPGEGWAKAGAGLRGSAVVVRGVCVATAQKRLVSNTPQLVASELPEAPAGGAPALLGERPVRVIDQLLGFAPSPHPGGWPTKIAGVVTATPFPGTVIVQDATGAATVWAQQQRTEVSVGERVEVTGLLRVDGFQVSLTRATIKPLGPGKQPDPVSVQAIELVNRSRDALLIKMEGRTEAVRADGSSTAITLIADNVQFEALVPGTPDKNGLAKLKPGSRVAVVGVPFDTAPDGKLTRLPTLFLGDADAVTVLEAPPAAPAAVEPAVTSARTSYLIAGLVAVIAAGGAGLWLLWGRVRRVTAAIAGQASEKTKLERQLQEATKLESVGRLAGGIAHDFNNLLTVINGCAELLADEAGAVGRAAELTDDIRRAGERAAALTRQLLTFTRRRDLKILAVDLNAVVLDTARLLARVIRENVTIETDLEPGIPAVRGDASLLQQIIMNLAVNARDAMPRGGTITFRTTVAFDAGAALGSVPRRYVRLTVSDTGTGMTDEVKARLFEPFFTTKEDGKGTGLGLATVYRVIQGLSGYIQLDSAVGRGTTFQIDLRIHGDPVSDHDILLSPSKSHLGQIAGAQQLTGTTVLVVEDNEMVRNLLAAALTSDGATVLGASCPAQALEVLHRYLGRVDLLLTDVVMPGMSGPELAERLTRERPGTRVVYMSGHGTEEVQRTGILEDQVEFLQKPFTPEHLTSRLLGVLRRAAAEQ